ncbi:MAG: four helix bundle protein [Candidatus Zixiibacteriota bacterium]|nr:MAG: four helix bundle protein [candidate division Zixibacteria bacterium]
MKDYKSLKAWQRSHRLVLDVYRVTGDFPKSEQFGLTSQIRRASVSIPANLAGGCGRHGDLDLARFFDIALGSSCEVEYYLLLSRDLNYLPQNEFASLSSEMDQIKKMIAAFILKVRPEAKVARA